MAVFLYKNYAYYKDNTFQQKYGELLKDLDAKSFLASLYYILFMI